MNDALTTMRNEEVSRTLNTMGEKPSILLVFRSTEVSASRPSTSAASANSSDSLVKCSGNIAPTLVSRMGTGGGQRSVLALNGDQWKPRDVYLPHQGGNGFGINADGASYTLNTVDRHIVAVIGI